MFNSTRQKGPAENLKQNYTETTAGGNAASKVKCSWCLNSGHHICNVANTEVLRRISISNWLALDTFRTVFSVKTNKSGLYRCYAPGMAGPNFQSSAWKFDIRARLLVLASAEADFYYFPTACRQSNRFLLIESGLILRQIMFTIRQHMNIKYMPICSFSMSIPPFSPSPHFLSLDLFQIMEQINGTWTINGCICTKLEGGVCLYLLLVLTEKWGRVASITPWP